MTQIYQEILACIMVMILPGDTSKHSVCNLYNAMLIKLNAINVIMVRNSTAEQRNSFYVYTTYNVI